jgi:hypothetical protein
MAQPTAYTAVFAQTLLCAVQLCCCFYWLTAGSPRAATDTNRNYILSNMLLDLLVYSHQIRSLNRVYILLCVCVVVFRFDLKGLVLARQVLYHLSHSPSPFCFSYFLNRVIFITRLAWTVILFVLLSSWDD